MEKKTIIAIVLVGIIIIFTQTDFYKKQIIPSPTSFPDSSGVTEILERPEPTETESPQPVPTLDPPSLPEAEQPAFAPATDSNQNVEELTVVSPLFRAKLSNQGGGLIQWQLLQYLDADSNLVDLIPLGRFGLPDLGMVVAQDSIRFNRHIYNAVHGRATSAGEIVLNAGSQPFTISYVLDLDGGRRVEKTFVFYGDRYNFDLDVSLTGFSNATIDRSYQLRWDSSLLPTEVPLSDDLGYIKVYAKLGDDLQDFDIDEDVRGLQQEQVSGTVNWTALRTKYFCAAIVPIDGKGRGISYEGRGFAIAPEQSFKHYNYAISMPFTNQGTQSNRFTFYLGPIEYNELKALDLDLESLIMSSGGYERLFRPFSIIILVSLKFMHNYIDNYGWVIVVFSVLIKIILYPLTHKSYTSMKKMQMVQPLMTEVREKYKSDPQRLNKEMMKLYKEHGVNPLGGCLPMLLQMPLLIGLFIVFRSTIELRGTEFLWWITDLSKPDTIFMLPFSIPIYGNQVTILPIVMGLSMFLQQKSTISDPRQKMMMYFMPVFFVLLFNTFPSGLNLYYTLFNFLTILQQKFVKTEQLQIKPVEEKPGPTKKRKK